VTRLVLVEAFPTGYLERILTKKLKEDPVLSDVTVSGLDGRLILSLSSDVIFEGSNADLSEAGREMIANLSTIFGQFGNQVDVQGHTAPLPIPEDSKYNNRSALTLGRALAVAKYLRVNGFHGDPTVTGLAESGYKHIDQSIPEAVRFALAQRVDLVILPEARGQ
jgi:chemotaxis protein MotB